MSSKKGERHRDTPTSTRSYRSRQKMRIQEIFDVHKMLEILDPDDNELEVIIRAAATIDAVNRRSGAYGDPPFPAPIDFVEHLFNKGGDEEHPVWVSREQRDRSVLMLRCISKLRDFIQENLPYINDGEVDLTCPICGAESIDIVLGPKPTPNGTVKFDDSQTVILDMKILCGCEPFKIGDVDEIEDTLRSWLNK